MPRPFLPEGLAREKTFPIRFTKKEFEAIKKYSNLQNLYISSVIRKALNKYAKELKLLINEK